MERKGFVCVLAAVLVSSAVMSSLLGSWASASDVQQSVVPTFPTQPHDPIVIYDESYLQVGSNGITGGTGSADDPFVIEGWEISVSDPVGGGLVIFGTTSHILIRDVYVHSCYYGIWLQGTANVAIENNVVTNYVSGIVIWTSSDASVVSNQVANNGELGGVSIWESTRVAFSSNQLFDDGLYISGWTKESYVTQIISTDNSVNGKPLLYYAGVDGLTISDLVAGECIIVDSKNVRIAGLAFEDTDVGIELAFVEDIGVSGCSFARITSYGLDLEYVTNAVASGNVFEDCQFTGLSTWACTNVAIAGNSFSSNYYAIGLWDSDLEVVSGNFVSGGGSAAFIDSSTNLVVIGNTITGCEYYGVTTSSNYQRCTSIWLISNEFSGTWRAIDLYDCSNSVVRDNRLIGNSEGVVVTGSDNALVYHNSFLYNLVQASNQGGNSNIAWGNGYPSGGNYWSDYSGVDKMRGPDQDMKGRDRIGDTPYVIGSEDVDRYPLMNEPR